MPSALRGGTQTYWRDWGEGAPELLMLHCSLAHSGVWDGVVKRLGFGCVAFDAPGHGRSGPIDPSVDYQDQCLRVTESFVADEPLHLIGHSFGATVALRLALERPATVRSLVLIEPVLFAAARGSAGYDGHLTGLVPFGAALEAGDSKRAAEIFTATWGTGVPWSAMREEQRHALADQIHIIPAQDGALFGDTAGLLTPGRLERLEMPVLLLEGETSPPIIPVILDALASRLPNTERAVVPGAGHMVPITHPGAVAAEINAFLRA